MKDASANYITYETATKRQPVELYRFWKPGEFFAWNYTSGDVEVVYDGSTYEPAPIQRGNVELDVELQKSSLKIGFAHIVEPLTEFIKIAPENMIWILVSKLHRQQTPLETSTVFVGIVQRVGFNDEQAEAECVGFESFLEKQACRYRYQASCNNTIYDTRCGVSEATYEVTATVDSISADGLTITSTTFGAQANGYFTRGYITENVTGAPKRLVTGHTGNDITIRYKIDSLESGDTVKIYPGCDLQVSTCQNKFSNLSNFFGMPYTPVDNPVTRH